MNEPRTPARPLRAVVDELVRSGVRDVVICPGSRSTPLALALRSESRLRCWVHIDERAGAFFALGAAKASRRPTAILVTSGTAAAELAPALVEAHEGRVPLLALTADRPAELRDRGAPQAIDQDHLFGRFAKWYAELPVPDDGELAESHVRGIIRRAVATAATAPAGPVHLNLPYREPLVPSGDLGPSSSPAARRTRAAFDGGVARTLEGRRVLDDEALADLGRRIAGARRGVIVCGPTGRAWLRCGRRGTGGRHGLPHHRGRPRQRPLRAARPLTASSPGPIALLRVAAFAEAHEPDLVLRFGGTPTSKALLGWLAATRAAQVVVDDGGWNEPTGRLVTMVQAEPARLAMDLAGHLERRGSRSRPGGADGWLASWQAAEAAATEASAAWLAELAEPFEGQAFADLGTVLPDDVLVLAGNSMPVRDWRPSWARDRPPSAAWATAAPTASTGWSPRPSARQRPPGSRSWPSSVTCRSSTTSTRSSRQRGWDSPPPSSSSTTTGVASSPSCPRPRPSTPAWACRSTSRSSSARPTGSTSGRSCRRWVRVTSASRPPRWPRPCAPRLASPASRSWRCAPTVSATSSCTGRSRPPSQVPSAGVHPLGRGRAERSMTRIAWARRGARGRHLGHRSGRAGAARLHGVGADVGSVGGCAAGPAPRHRPRPPGPRPIGRSGRPLALRPGGAGRRPGGTPHGPGGRARRRRRLLDGCSPGPRAGAAPPIDRARARPREPVGRHRRTRTSELGVALPTRSLPPDSSVTAWPPSWTPGRRSRSSPASRSSRTRRGPGFAAYVWPTTRAGWRPRCEVPVRAPWRRSTTTSGPSAARSSCIAGALDPVGLDRARSVAAGLRDARLEIIPARRSRAASRTARRLPSTGQGAPGRDQPSRARKDLPHDHRLDRRPRIRRHPLRALRDGHRQDHHRPAARPQRLPAGDRERAHRRLPARPRRRHGRRGAADRRWRHGLLLRRRHDRQGRGRLHRLRRHGPPQRPRPATAHPLAAHRGHRPRQRLRHRRRARAARRLRPDHRLAERHLRPDRPQGRQLRWRLRRDPAGAHRGPQEGARDLVPLSPVHGRSRRWRWASSTPSCRSSGWRTRVSPGPRRSWPRVPPPSAC